jgi:hypothetical protein
MTKVVYVCFASCKDIAGSLEFDPDREISLNVINEKRSKIRGAFIQIIGLYRQEKEDKKVKSLEKMLHEYEAERYKMEQSFSMYPLHYKYFMFISYLIFSGYGVF